MARRGTPPAGKKVEAHRHAEAKRRNIPTAEYQSVIQKEAEQPLRVAYERRNRDLDPQLVWYARDRDRLKYRRVFSRRDPEGKGAATRSSRRRMDSSAPRLTLNYATASTTSMAVSCS